MILTDEEIAKVFDDLCDTDHCTEMFDYLYARAIEAAVMAEFERVGSIIHGTEDSKFGAKDELTDAVDDETGYWENRGYDLIPVYALKEKKC